MEEPTGMDIDVVEGKYVSEPTTSEEIEYKVPVPPPAQEPEKRTHFAVEDYHDMQWVLNRYPFVTDLSFRRTYLSHSGEHQRSSQPPKNLYLITEFKHLKRIHIESFGFYDAFIPKEFATSPTCTHLEFDRCIFYMFINGEKRSDKLFARTVKRNKVLQSLSFNGCIIPIEVLQIMMQSKSITEMEFKNDTTFGPKVWGNNPVIQLLPLILANKNLIKFEIYPRVDTSFGSFVTDAEYQRKLQANRQEAIDAWIQIDRHLGENRQKLMVFPILAALQLTGARDKGAILDVLPDISRLLGDPPLTYEQSEQMAQLIEPVVGGKRKSFEPKPLPFMFQK